MTLPDLLALRQAAYLATSAYTRAHNTYWASPHEERAYRTCQDTATRLEVALTALLAYLESTGGHDIERDRTARQQAIVCREVALVEERAQLAVHRVNTW